VLIAPAELHPPFRVAARAEGEAIDELDAEGDVLPICGVEHAAIALSSVQAEATNIHLLTRARMRL